MITSEEFERVAHELSKRVDPCSLLRQYHRYIRDVKSNSGQDVRSFIVQHLPSPTDVLIDDIIKTLPDSLSNASLKIQAFARHRKYAVLDSIEGMYITSTAYQELTTFIRTAMPIRSAFERVCSKYSIPSDNITYSNVVKQMGKLVTKEVNHPCCMENDYLLLPFERVEELILSTLGSVYNSVAEEATLIPIETGAKILSVSPRTLQVWRDEKEEDAWYLGTAFISKETVNRLSSEWKKTVLLCEESLKDLFPEIPPLLLTAAIKHIETSERLYKRLLKPGTFPQQDKGPYARDKSEARSIVMSVFESEPFIPRKQFSEVLGIKESSLSNCIEEGRVIAIDTADGPRLTYAELSKHKEALRTQISMDTVVQQVVDSENSSFKLNKYNHRSELMEFCDSNNWWSLSHVPADCIISSAAFGTVLNVSEAASFSEHIRLFLAVFGKNSSEALSAILKANEERFPKTAKLLEDFLRGYEEIPACSWEMADMLFFLLGKTNSEITELSKAEIERIAGDFRRNCSLACCSLFSELLDRRNLFPARIRYHKSGYKRDTSAYSLESFAIINYLCVNFEAWEKEDLITKAVDNPEYANLWLYVASHCYSAIRGTDYPRLPPPWLPDSPEETLSVIRSASKNIQNEESILNKARKVTTSFLAKIEALSFTPHKVESVSNVSPIYFDIPQSCYDCFGIILSIAAAHFYLNSHTGNDMPSSDFIHAVTDKTLCFQFFGHKFVKACGNRGFSGLRANKALIQSREYEYRNQDGTSPYVSYAMASALRSHKGGYGKLSDTTALYLRDANFSGMTPEFVAKQMLERGTCSWIIDRVFETCFGKKYSSLSITGKTRIIQAANVDAYELTAIKDLIQKEQDAVVLEIGDVFQTPSASRAFLDNYLSGRAKGKNYTSDCAMLASGRGCLFKNRQSCQGCLYEIRSKVAFAHYAIEYKRLEKLLSNPGLTEKEHNKYKALATKSLSIVFEMLSYLDSSASEAEIGLYFRLYELTEGGNNGINECSL